MPEATLPDENIIPADAVIPIVTPEPDSIDVEEAMPDPESIVVPRITGGVWVSRNALIVCLLAMMVLSAGLSWWLFRRADVAEQGRLEALQRVEELRRKQKQDQLQHNKQNDKNRVQMEFDQAVEREKREAAQGDLIRERNWLQFENNRLRQEPVKPSRVIIVR